jgi:hypothetical protein
MRTSTRSLSTGAAVAVVLFAILAALPARIAAFSKTWVGSCADGGLWDDSPGAGQDNESAFFWFRTDTAANEYCTYYSEIQGLDTSAYPKLSVRAAVNDGAVLYVGLRRFPGGPNEFPDPPCTGELLGSVTISGNSTPAAQSRSEFVTAWVDLSPDWAGQVCITLNDAPNTVASERASALIDYIKVGRNISPPCQPGQICLDTFPSSTGWLENFSRPEQTRGHPTRASHREISSQHKCRAIHLSADLVVGSRPVRRCCRAIGTECRSRPWQWARSAATESNPLSGHPHLRRPDGRRRRLPRRVGDGVAGTNAHRRRERDLRGRRDPIQLQPG